MSSDEQCDRIRHAIGRMISGAYLDVVVAESLLKEKARLAPSSCEAAAHTRIGRVAERMRSWIDDAAELAGVDRASLEAAIAAAIAGSGDTVPVAAIAEPDEARA